MRKVLIIGAGITGLSAALEFEEQFKDVIEYEIFELADRAGGLCRTESVDGFSFDYTGHLLHARTDVFKKFLNKNLPNLVSNIRKSFIHINNTLTRYPFQSNLYGLPADSIIECIYDFCKVYFSNNTEPILTFEDWIQRSFGQSIAELFFIPYNSKLFKTHPKWLSPDCGGRFIPHVDLKQFLKGAISFADENLGYNAHFLYPQQGGIESLIKVFLEKVKRINLNEKIISIDPSKSMAISSQGRIINYDFIISTQPLPELVKNLKNQNDNFYDFGEKLKWVSVYNINLGIPNLQNDSHWIYFPESKYIFHRLGFPHNFSNFMAPQNSGSIYVELSYLPGDSLNVSSIFDNVIRDLKLTKIIEENKTHIVEKNIDIPYGYVIFDHFRYHNLPNILSYLETLDIFSIGRFGAWNYSSMEDAFLMGKDAANKIGGKVKSIIFSNKKQVA